MEKLIQLRFLERDRTFAETLTCVKNDMSARGLLRSSYAVKAGHEELVNEFGTSIETDADMNEQR